MTATAKPVGPFLVFTEGEYSRTVETEQECRDFAAEADEKTAGNVRVTWAPVQVAEAAPELLEAARKLLCGSCGYVIGQQGVAFHHQGSCSSCDPVRAAIKFATGETAHV